MLCRLGGTGYGNQTRCLCVHARFRCRKIGADERAGLERVLDPVPSPFQKRFVFAILDWRGRREAKSGSRPTDNFSLHRQRKGK